MTVLKGIATVLLWSLVLLSFTANALLLRLLLDARAQGAEALQLGAQAVGDLQASAIETTLNVEREVSLAIVVPAGTVLTTAAGPVELTEPLTVDTTTRLAFDVPLRLNVADTPLNASLLDAQAYLDRLYARWQADPVQVFLAPVPR